MNIYLEFFKNKIDQMKKPVNTGINKLC